MSLVRELEGRAVVASPADAPAALGRLYLRLLEENRLRSPAVLAGVARAGDALAEPEAAPLRALGLGDVPFFVGRSGEPGATLELRLWVRLHKKRRLRKVELGAEDPCPP